MANSLHAKWYSKTVKTLQINGKSIATQKAYARAGVWNVRLTVFR